MANFFDRVKNGETEFKTTTGLRIVDCQAKTNQPYYHKIPIIRGRVAGRSGRTYFGIFNKYGILMRQNYYVDIGNLEATDGIGENDGK